MAGRCTSAETRGETPSSPEPAPTWVDVGRPAAHIPETGATLIRPARSNEKGRANSPFLKPLRQLIESVNDTLKGQLDLESPGGRPDEGVFARVLQRLAALTAAIWHNSQTGQPALRSLIAYDHCSPLGIIHLV